MSFQTMYDSVKRNIERFGTDIVLGTKTQTGTIDFATGKEIEAMSTQNIRGVISNYKDSEIIDGVINIDDLKLTIQTNAEVKEGDLIALFESQYMVQNVSSLIREGMVIKTVLQLRETYGHDLGVCTYSIGGIDGTEFKMDGIWSKNCVMFKA